jgi:hypothetical protein
MRAMARKLEKYNCSFLDLADHIENGGSGLSDADKQKISAAIESARIEGYAEGVPRSRPGLTTPASSRALTDPTSGRPWHFMCRKRDIDSPHSTTNS